MVNICLIDFVLTAAAVFALGDGPQRPGPTILYLSGSPFPMDKLEFDIALYTPIKRARLLEIDGVSMMRHSRRKAISDRISR